MNAFREGSRRPAQNWLVLALGVAGGAILLVLLARTAVGAIDRQLGAGTIAILSALGFALAMTAWRLDDAARSEETWQQRAARAAAALLSGLMFGLLVARDSTAGVVSVTVMALTWAVAAALRLRPAFEASLLVQRSPQPQLTSALASSTSLSAQLPGELAMTGVTNEAENDPSLQMQLRRCRSADGETIEIHARLEFVPGAREAVLHVPFWPALSATPVVECEPLDASDIELRVTAAEPYGLRLAARLPKVTTVRRSVLIGVEVQVADEAAAADISAAA